MLQTRGFCLAGLAVVGTLVWLSGCPSPSNPNPAGSGSGALVPFDSAESLLSYFKQQSSASVNRGVVGDFATGGDLALPSAAPASDQAGGAENTSNTTTGAFSTTNLQEAGVDESDVFKSDGTYFYMGEGQSLRIVRAIPADQMAEVARLDLGIQISSLYLNGATVIALGNDYGSNGPNSPDLMIWPPYYLGSTLQIVQVDVSNPASPSIAGQMSLDGSLVSSRLTNGRLIVVLTIQPNLPSNPTPVAIGTMTLEQVMPKLRLSGVEKDLVPWNQWLRPESPDGYFMTAIVTLDAAAVASVVASVAVLANAGTIYASPNALYITDATYDPDNNYREQTSIRKFAFDADGAARYTASGTVPGRLLNQFSLSEYQGYLQIATHVNNFQMFPVGMGTGTTFTAPFSSSAQAAPSADTSVASNSASQPYNGVYVLGQTGDKLEVTGFVDGLAPNETLYSARFLGDHGFLVTFHKIDPLFVLDLRDPTKPAVLGELKVPGFSDYLHPWDATHLVGVGKYTISTDQGFDWFQGVQVSLFDVSDWSNPTVVQQITLGGRGSECDVSETHKAFTFLPQSNLLALPMGLTTVDSIPWEYGDPTFSGVVVFRVDPATGFTELGRVDAVQSSAGSTPGDGSSPMAPMGWMWWSQWRRAAIIGDEVYAVTPAGVRAAAVADFSATQTVTLGD